VSEKTPGESAAPAKSPSPLLASLLGEDAAARSEKDHAHTSVHQLSDSAREKAPRFADREIIGRAPAAALDVVHAQYQLDSAHEQANLRRYKIEVGGGERRLSVHDVEQYAHTVAKDYAAENLDAAIANEQGIFSGGQATQLSTVRSFAEDGAMTQTWLPTPFIK